MSTDGSKGSNGGQALVRAPIHPVAQLQKPFEESMLESLNDLLDQDVPLDALTRRTMLLEAPTYNRVIAGRWKQKPGEKYHPLWKLIAQMSFGMHLLAENMALSEEEVMRILQSHVDDIDGFLERTTEDLELAQSDIHERLRCLKLPLAHGEVFDRMLEDRAFRASILDGNEKIDHVISRTKRAAKDALKDVQKGFDATNTLEKYLAKLQNSWQRESPEHEAVLVAMLGNAEGWRRAFLELHLEGNKLAGSLKKLGEVVAEMQRRAAAVSRNIVAKQQRPKHPTSHRSAMLSQSGPVPEHKPLPTEPGQIKSSRTSSRSTNMTGFSSRPGSGNRPSQGLSGGQSPESRRNASTDMTHRSITYQAEAEHPIELPADVPEEVLRQAPVSVKNRMSLTLGLAVKDKSEHRISSVYYPRALGDLLKTPAASQLLGSPKATANAATPLSAVITSPTYMLEAQADYFADSENTPTFGKAQSENKHGLITSPIFEAAARGSVRASIVEPASRTRTRSSSIRSPAFTSHPAVMAMAIPPAELPASSASLMPEDVSDTGKVSAPSSIGEPGPEMADTETTRPVSASEPGVRVEDSGFAVSVVPASAEGETFAAATIRTDQVQNDAVSVSGAQDQNPNQDKQLSSSPKQEESPRPLEQIPKIPTQSPRPPPVPETTRTVDAKDEEVEIIIHINESDVSKEPFCAELEATAPVKMQIPQDFGPVELEAPVQTFKLPPRPIAASQNPDKEVPRASIRQLDDFFKLPTEQSIKPGMKPNDFGKSMAPEPIRPLKLKLAKKDGKVVPVPISSPATPISGRQRESPGPSKLRMDVVADIIETMSNTPPGSPVHDNRSSGASSNSAQRWSHRSTRSLGPPDQAPAPPGPGGRQMVNPDFAAAGQFEGERKMKQKKKSSGFVNMNKEKWKNLFLNNGSSTNASSSSGASLATKSERTTSTTRPSSEAVPAAEMLTGSGKDVLWFKGESKKALGVSSA
ncbi:uncharacterized protein A1O9_05130 [Exophiala aquamarina CBS 119918]|uniref:Uncharacterized protein n=1 Tax=Exophiala aquamarina CBS 119918 TaxID=1182545 RepID=A0A072PXI5_9EURO|nr:uncharacterized protein A1O9_05130 [Exophiala aquamarina CBS 119918]KEF60280.1 hypothetical protein A1O9_05130 [Exophiala aquamarina CBS 119918]